MAKKKEETKEIKLTPKQENFCNYYIETASATEAYRKAYVCGRMKDKTINERSSRLLKEYKISTRVKELQKELQERSDITKDEATKVLSNMVRTDVSDIISVIVEKIHVGKGKDKKEVEVKTLSLKEIEKLTEAQRQSIKSIAQTKHGIKVEMYSKIDAIDRLSKMLGWDEAQKLETTITGGINIDEWIKARSKE